MVQKFYIVLLGIAMALLSCSNDDTTSEPTARNFKMGFTTWSYGPELQNVNDTYTFIENHADLYTEHIDQRIPWNAWITDAALPIAFTDEITGRANRKIENKELLLSVSPLNSNRDDLAGDFDGTTPSFSDMNALEMADAYFKHVRYLIDNFRPDYLVIAIEVNELRLRAEIQWNAYTSLIQNVKARIKEVYPNLPISESISLHNLYEPDVANPTSYLSDMTDYMNQMDFVAISFYPHLKNLGSATEFQRAFDILHANIHKPIAFVESAHIAEDLIVPNLSLSTDGSETEQNNYLDVLLSNAQEHNYEFIVWWCHRDYDALWEVFPPELKDIGQLWRDTGLLDENGNPRLAMSTWEAYMNK
ncbi:MAG: hypothetical protein AAFX53_18620 [Bacteroidota bacterium]